jgi:hypothetical protein
LPNEEIQRLLKDWRAIETEIGKTGTRYKVKGKG